MRASMARSSLFAVIAGLFISTWAQAGPLATAGTFASGSTPFDNGGTLKGYVDWAVFNPGTWPAGYTGYSPTSGELAYAYQVFVTGTAPVSSFELVLTDPADNIGSFAQLGGVAPSSQVLNPLTSAKWTFPGIPQGSMSYGLAFSSIRIPQSLFATVVDTGQSTWVIPLPSPGSTGIPEPATLGLAAMGCVVLGLRRRR
jgi:PEP-CTERM motif-containing protein